MHHTWLWGGRIVQARICIAFQSKNILLLNMLHGHLCYGRCTYGTDAIFTEQKRISTQISLKRQFFLRPEFFCRIFSLPPPNRANLEAGTPLIFGHFFGFPSNSHAIFFPYRNRTFASVVLYVRVPPTTKTINTTSFNFNFDPGQKLRVHTVIQLK